jgi:hypothetical protein
MIFRQPDLFKRIYSPDIFNEEYLNGMKLPALKGGAS